MIHPGFAATEGHGDRPVPGDVLNWPFLVLDDVAEQVYESAPGHRIYRRTGAGSHLVAIEVRAADDLAALTDAEAAGLRGIRFVRWNPAIARELVRVDARRCMFAFEDFWSPSDPLDLASLPATTRYLHMRYAAPVDPAGFTCFPELRYLAVPDDAFMPEGAEPPPPPVDDERSPDPTIAVDWTRRLPELRWLDLECVGSDLRPLAGHPRLRTVRAAHCHITALPAELMPALHEFLAPFSDCPDAEVERLRRLHPAARIRTTSREVLLDCIGAATRLQLRTGATCHPRPTDRVVYTTEDRAEICALLDLLQPHGGYERQWAIPGCDRGVMQFFGADGTLLAEVGLHGAGILHSARAWPTPAFLRSEEKAAALETWLAARGLQVGP